MNAELAVEALILGLHRDGLEIPEVHDVLHQIAELVGRRPQAVTGPGPTRLAAGGRSSA